MRLGAFRGPDPLDAFAPWPRLALTMAVQAVMTGVLVVVITELWGVVQIPVWARFGEVALFALVIAPAVFASRRSTPILHYLMVLLPLWIADMYLEAHVRALGQRAVWMYTPGTFIERIHPVPLRFFVTLSFDAILLGPGALFVSRLVARALRARRAPASTERGLPAAGVARPPRGGDFWILRVLGLGFFAYLCFLGLGALGASPWPQSVRQVYEMTYANPLLTADTTGKIFIMIALAFLAAFNRAHRPHATFLLAVGHAAATACVLLLRAQNPLGPHRDILMSSAIVDAACAAVFTVLALRARRGSAAHPAAAVDTFAFAPFAGGGLALGFGLLIVTARLHGGGPVALAALYAQPDPMVGNALTLHFTLAAVLLAASVSARNRVALLSAARFAAGAALVAVFVAAFAVGRFVPTHDGARLDVSFALLAHVAVLAAIVVAANPRRFAATSAENARGRWLFDAALPALLAFRPPLSLMSSDERRYFLARYVYRSPDARAAALCPEIADTAFAIGAAVDGTSPSRPDAATA